MTQGPLQAVVAVNAAGYGASMQMDATGNLLVGSGSASKLNITAATVVKVGPGRVCRVSIVAGGSAAGTVNDVATTGGAAAANEIAPLPTGSTQTILLDFPFFTGLVIVPGTGQTIAVSYD